MDDLFNSPVLRIEQPRKMLATQARYDVFDSQKTLVAAAVETDVRTRGQILKRALPAAPLPGAQILQVSTADGVPFLVVVKHEGNRLTEVRRPDSRLVGTIRAQRTTRHYTLHGAAEQRLGEVTGDLALRHFAVAGADGKPVGAITKKWAGLAKELLTTADRYTVEFTGDPDGTLRTLVVITGMMIDLTLYESKRLA